MLFRKLLLYALFLITAGFCMASEQSFAKTKTFMLWQLPSQSGKQMNSYVFKTIHDKIIVIDGGWEADADYLKGFLAALGNKVDLWFISHQHGDHIGALTAILEKPGDLKIDKIYGSLLDEEWLEGKDPGCLKMEMMFSTALKAVDKEVIELQLGQFIELDGLSIKIIGIKNPEITSNAVNNSSVAMKVWDSQKSVLFLGDLGVEGGEKILKSPYKKDLQSDYVQMAHHGQQGVSEEFYKVVAPKYCIWPTPLWLWNNDKGEGEGSGPWRTLEVRKWMDKLNIQKHYYLFEGLQTIH